uniref:Uncharacterized protein n=1 Tax=Anguilla anguilla TaxID=7936 RepID=A0A0E9PB28_ANGAN
MMSQRLLKRIMYGGKSIASLVFILLQYDGKRKKGRLVTASFMICIQQITGKPQAISID